MFPPDSTTDSHIYSVRYSRAELLAIGLKAEAIEKEAHYSRQHELHKLRSLWTDVGYLADFFDENRSYFRDPYWNGIGAERFALDVIKSVPDIFKELEVLHKEGRLDELFEILHSKGKVKKFKDLVNAKAKFGYINRRIAFRIYAVKLESGCYVITGGAIKIAHEMEDAPNTDIEIKKINAVNTKLEIAGVFDNASFIDFIAE